MISWEDASLRAADLFVMRFGDDRDGELQTGRQRIVTYSHDID